MAAAGEAPRPTVQEAVRRLVVVHGEQRLVEIAADLLAGARPEGDATVAEVAVGLSAHGTSVEQLRASGYGGYWWRVWGARALLYVWRDEAAPVVVAGLDDDAWRVAEMCLKVAARRELAEAAEGASRLLDHELGRVRATAVRALGVLGDTEHVPAVRAAFDDHDPGVRRAAGLALERMVVRLDLPTGLLP